MYISSRDGTISSHDFHLSARAFVEKWEIIDSALPAWSWIPLPKLYWIVSYEVEGYLSLEKLSFVRANKENGKSDIIEEDPHCFNEEEPNDDATLDQSYDHEVHYYDFHVLYSASYRVPVLYFRAYCSDGESLLLHDIEKYLPSNSAKMMVESKWTFVTQEEHPYLKMPWFRLHPCGTSEWMKLLFVDETCKSKDSSYPGLYIASWLSVVGQAVNLRIPIEMVND